MSNSATGCPPIAIVDDDQSVRESLPDLIRELGYSGQAYPSAEAFLASGCADHTKCLILDIAMPTMTGPALFQELQRQGRSIPTIFITAHNGDVVRPHLLAQGAVACLCKPFSDTALHQALKLAMGAP